MTVSSATTRNSYSGNASNDTFAYGFKIFDDDDITVIIRTDSTGAETVKTKTTHYTVTNVGNSSGGNVVFTSGNIPASGETVVLLRTTARTQLTDYVANDPFPAETHENALDKLTFIVQELEEEIGRSLKVSKTNIIATSEFTTSAADRANKLLSFDGSGDLTVTEGKVDTVTASVSAVSAGGSPTASATYTASSGALALAFGLVTGNTGATGSTGSAGAAGKNTGLAMTFSNSTSDADPGAGKVAFNNGTVSSVTEIYFDDVDDNSATVSSFIQSWDDVTNTTARGILLIVKETDPSVYGLFKVSGAVTNASGYSKVPVTHVVSNGSFSNTDGIQVSFAYSGADGSAGSAASIAVGSVTANTLSAGSSATAAVANAGSSSAGQFNFTFGIPTGATGATGPQGPQGPSGSGAGDLLASNNLSDLANAGTARTNLGLGTIATQANNSVNIDGGAIDAVTIGTNSAVTDLRVDNLKLDGNALTSTNTNGTIDLTANGTGNVVVKGNTNPGTVVFNCESNSHGQTVKAQPHSASVTNTLTLPPGGDGELVSTVATQTLTNKTLTSPSFSGDVSMPSDLTVDTTTLHVDSSNNRVGIGTASPSQLLSIVDSGSARMEIISGTSGTSIIDMGDTADSDIAGIRYSHADNDMTFRANNDVRMTIDSSGALLVHTSSRTGTSNFVVEADTSSENPMSVVNTRSSASTDYHILMYRAGNIVGSVQTSLSATSFLTSSDYRLKENVSYTWDATARLKQLKPARFNFIADADTTVDGFLAHEVQTIVPEAVSGTKDATEKYTDDDGKEQTRIIPQGIDQAKLVPLLVKTIQELEARITALEAG